MNKSRLIFHIDVNSAYLSWTAVDLIRKGKNMDLRDIPSVIGGNEKETIEFYPLYSHQIVSIRDSKERPYRTIVGLFLHGRNKDLCYINKDNTAYYFFDFNKVLIGNLIDWYKRVFGEFE